MDADDDQIKIPKLEINPTPIGYPHVWARSRITNIDSILDELDKIIINKYMNTEVINDEEKKKYFSSFFFKCILYIHSMIDSFK